MISAEPPNSYVHGFFRNPGEGLGNLKKLRCCHYSVFKPVTPPSALRSHSNYRGMADWRTCFDSPGWCTAGGEDQEPEFQSYAITGFYRGGCNDINCLDSVSRAILTPCFDTVYNYADIESIFNEESWAYCRQGYFLYAIRRSSGHELRSIEELRCVGRKGSRLKESNCEEVNLSWGERSWAYCPPGKFVHGFFRNPGECLGNVKKLSCCNYSL